MFVPQGLTWGDGEASWEGVQPVLQEDGRGNAENGFVSCFITSMA